MDLKRCLVEMRHFYGKFFIFEEAKKKKKK